MRCTIITWLSEMSPMREIIKKRKVNQTVNMYLKPCVIGSRYTRHIDMGEQAWVLGYAMVAMRYLHLHFVMNESMSIRTVSN